MADLDDLKEPDAEYFLTHTDEEVATGVDDDDETLYPDEDYPRDDD